MTVKPLFDKVVVESVETEEKTQTSLGTCAIKEKITYGNN